MARKKTIKVEGFNRLPLALAHKAAAEDVARAKVRLETLRIELAESLGDDGKPGTRTYDLGGGNEVKIEVRSYVSTDQELAETARGLMQLEGETGKLLAERLFKDTVEVRLGELNSLPAEFAKHLVGVVTISPGTPSVKLIQPA